MKQLLFLIIFFMALGLSAQTNEELATYYYQNQEYEKALLYLEDIYKSTPTDTYFQFYLISLKELARFEEAQDLVEKHMKRNKGKLELMVELGNLMTLNGEGDKAKKFYEAAIDEAGASRSQVINLANAFVQANLLEEALRTYEMGRKKAPDNYPYSYEVASLYGSMGDHARMIDEYMALIGYNQGYLRTVQNNLSRSFDFTSDDPKVDLLKASLLKNVQAHPEQGVYYEMLIWLFTQRKEFNAAFIQAKAIDKRQQEDGRRLIALASLCTNNEAYDVAAKAYAYIVEEKGPGTRYYETSKALELVSAKRALTSSMLPEREKVVDLEQRFSQTIAELGRDPEASRLLREQAELNLRYLQDGEKALLLLDSALKSPGISAEFEAQCKLDMGDALVAQGYIWDAYLYYSQVEKDFKQDILGAEAKFRTARIYYYAGDFEWAQGQLDVLKASTSKLISNDAMDLSLLITDNYSLDTLPRPMELYAKADLLTFQNRLDEASLTLDSLSEEFPVHPLEDEIIYQRAEIAKKKGDFIVATELLERIVDLYFDDILADNALKDLAELQERVFKDEAKAMEYYQKLFMDYPGSLYSAEARKRFRFLRGDKQDEEPIEPREIRGIEN